MFLGDNPLRCIVSGAKAAGAPSMAEPQLPSTPGDDSPPRGTGLEDEGLNVGYTPDAGIPVSLAPPPPPG